MPSAITLGIGDGANDVGMITKANIGVGISGNEGNQAVSSSDYALSQFKDLKTLLLYHGRESYRKNAFTICYIFYKNLLQTLPVVLFGVISGFSGVMIYENYINQVFNLLFTSLPIMVFSTLD
jgi:phospholipid-transporting ATPase